MLTPERDSPTEDEIRLACERTRDGWSEHTRWARAKWMQAPEAKVAEVSRSDMGIEGADTYR